MDAKYPFRYLQGQKAMSFLIKRKVHKMQQACQGSGLLPECCGKTLLQDSKKMGKL